MIRLLLRGSALQSVGFAIDIVASLMLMPFLIHGLGDRGYGTWAIIGTIISRLWLLDLGLASTTQRYLANATGRGALEEVSAIYSTAIIMFWLVGSVGLLVVLGILPFAGWWFPPEEATEFRIALAIAGTNIAITFPFSVVSGLLNARLRTDLTVASGIAGTLTRVLLTYLLVTLGYGMVGVATANLLATLCSRCILAVAKRRVAPDARFRPSL